jgi:dipeptidyl aminopeptidase/acylaminoacyl peptidase
MIRSANLTVDGLKIIGQLYTPENREPPYPAVILCHGVPSGVVDPTDGGYPLLAETISKAGFAVYTFRFRGTGESEGNFDIVGWTHDLEAVIDYLWNLDEIDDAHIALIGFSAGASVSVYVGAHDKRVSAVAACACPADFSAISDSGKPETTIHYFRKIGIIRDEDYPPSVEDWLNDFRKINALHSVADISPRPLLLVHAAGDNVVPVSNTERLYMQAGQPKKKVILEGSEHRLRRNEKAVETIIEWLKKRS